MDICKRRGQKAIEPSFQSYQNTFNQEYRKFFISSLHLQKVFLYRNYVPGAKEMPQWLRGLDIFPKDKDLIPRTQMTAQNYL